MSERLSDPETAARALLGGTITAGGVTLRIVEVEAYGGPATGPWPDSAAHSFRGPTRRNEVMFGPAGRLYVYLSYGMHLCANVVCGSDGTAGAVLLRSGEVILGVETCRSRRSTARADRDLARGPGNLGRALGLSSDHNGVDVFDASGPVTVTLGGRASTVEAGPRVGVSTDADRAWRFWLPGSRAVSAYRRSPRAAAPTRSP